MIAAKEERRLRHALKPGRQWQALRNTLPLLAFQLALEDDRVRTLLYLPPRKAESSMRTRKRLMDAMRIGLEALGITTNYSSDHPARYYNLMPLDRHPVSVMSPDEWRNLSKAPQ